MRMTTPIISMKIDLFKLLFSVAIIREDTNTWYKCQTIRFIQKLTSRQPLWGSKICIKRGEKLLHHYLHIVGHDNVLVLYRWPGQ
jgi:hypothetical protein